MILAFSAAAGGEFRPETPAWQAPRAPSVALAEVAADTLRYLEAADDPNEGDVEEATKIQATLRWVVDVATEDRASGADRLADPTFLSRCLSGSRWVPDVPRPGEQIRLTRYLAYSVEGRAAPEGAYSHALWALPDDEAGLSEEEAAKLPLMRFKYTRQDVAAGVYREGGAAYGRAAPLVWLTDQAHEEALMQGTIAVVVPGELAPRLYNVDRNNGIPYDRGITDTHLQRRYWYFRAVDRVRGWGMGAVPHIALAPEVAVAGDLHNLGLGRLFAVQTADGLRLVVLADTGGAFQPNLHQLDLYAGIFPSRSAFDRATSGIGDTAKAWAVAVRDVTCR